MLSAAQDGALDLSAGSLGQLGSEVHDARVFVWRGLMLNMRL
jgi:hypothetical protein